MTVTLVRNLVWE